MATPGICPKCGRIIRSDEQKCPECSILNEQYAPISNQPLHVPKTIEELKRYCAEHGMPLERMRFFIGENFKEPKAFGIYRENNQFVVYKNKASGERSVRYCGSDEAYAVNELYLKLMEECHLRGIYPNGENHESGKTRTISNNKTKKAMTLLLLILLFLFGIWYTKSSHNQDGYYRLPNQSVVYRYGSRWYEYHIFGNSWIYSDSVGYNENDLQYLGDDYDRTWGASDFKESSAWRDIRDRHSSGSSDYDSWDSNDTDWDSDW